MPLSIPKSQAEIDRIQSERKRAAFEAAAKAPFHAERLKGIDPDKLDDPDAWASIPVLNKEELRALTPRQFMDAFNRAPRETIQEYWRSGGSTGKPLFYPRTFEDMKYMFLGFRRGVDLAGIKAGDTAHISFPLGIHPVGHMYARVCQQAGVGVNWCGSGASTPSAVQVQLIEQMQPTVWMGMSSYALHLANLAEVQGIDLAGSSVKTVLCSAEPISAAKRDKIERSWGAEVVDTFGMTECCLMGAEDGARDGFRIWTDMFLVEILDPETYEPVAEGETGTLVSTCLWNINATPFIRWDSGDLVSYRRAEAGGEAGDFAVFPVVKHAHRTTGFFKVRGVNITHSDFEDLMFRNAALNDFKCAVVATGDLDELRVSIEIKQGMDNTAVVKAVGEDVKRVFEVTPEIEVLKTGTLAAEFEGTVKAPRFQDLRE
jgi:phenylacetate-CoA ligase